MDTPKLASSIGLYHQEEFQIMPSHDSDLCWSTQEISSINKGIAKEKCAKPGCETLAVVTLLLFGPNLYHTAVTTTCKVK
jgi:hypothetical protein